MSYADTSAASTIQVEIQLELARSLTSRKQLREFTLKFSKDKIQQVELETAFA